MCAGSTWPTAAARLRMSVISECRRCRNSCSSDKGWSSPVEIDVAGRGNGADAFCAREVSERWVLPFHRVQIVPPESRRRF
jgi:hypothetical protein